jgi:DNA-binding NtrC family response regulator
MDRLASYDWPGNVRELENVIERAVVLSRDREIGPELIPDHVSPGAYLNTPPIVIPREGIKLEEVMLGQERRYIEAALEAAGGVQKKAAELLHVNATTLNEKMKRYKMRPRKKGETDEESAQVGQE